jgi:hypothetical protein
MVAPGSAPLPEFLPRSSKAKLKFAAEAGLMRFPRLIIILALAVIEPTATMADNYPIQGSWVVTKIVTRNFTKAYHDDVITKFCKEGEGERIIFKRNRSWLVSNGKRFDYVDLKSKKLIKRNTYRLTEPSQSTFWRPIIELKVNGEVEYTTNAGSVWTLRKCPKR